MELKQGFAIRSSLGHGDAQQPDCRRIDAQRSRRIGGELDVQEQRCVYRLGLGLVLLVEDLARRLLSYVSAGLGGGGSVEVVPRQKPAELRMLDLDRYNRKVQQARWQREFVRAALGEL